MHLDQRAAPCAARQRACVSIVGGTLRVLVGNSWSANALRSCAACAPSGHHAIDCGAVLGAVNASALRAAR